MKAKLLQAELEATGPRQPTDVKVLSKHRPSQDSPPPGAEGHPLWSEYIAYWERRFAELQQRKADKGPLQWEGYQQMRGQFARGLAFERAMVSKLRADAALPRAQRRWLKDFDQPRIETHVGVAKADLRFADVLVMEEKHPAGQPPRVETFSFKSRNLLELESGALEAQIIADAGSALRYYGETLNILRDGIRQRAHVQRVRLVYEGGPLKPKDPNALEAAVDKAMDEVEGVEVLFE